MTWKWFEDVEAGESYDYGSYTFERERAVAFARAYDPQPFHVDEEAGRNSHFCGLAASGWHTAAGYMKCCAAFVFAKRDEMAARREPLPPLGPSPGFRNMQWKRPVLVGDTVSYSAVVLQKREMASRPEWGLVFYQVTGVNQRGEDVFSFNPTLMVARKPRD